MIQRLKLLLIVFASCIVVDSYAQKVVVDGAGRVIIDASAIQHTTIPKARTTDATLSGPGTNTLTNISSELTNEKVFRTFEVLKKDLREPLGPNKLRADWLAAIEACYNLSDDGGGWRLPTERELSLINILYYKLIAIQGFEKLNNNFWSATDGRYKDTACSLRYSRGMSALIDKVGLSYVRCIRDITP